MKTLHLPTVLIILTVIFVSPNAVISAQGIFPVANNEKTYKIDTNAGWKDWSPTSNMLVASVGGSLLEYAGNGTELGILYHNQNFSISNIRFNHDGTKIAFLNDYTSENTPLDIYVLDLKNNQLSQLTHGAHIQGLVWTPDGNMIYAEKDLKNYWHFKILKLDLKNNSTSVILDKASAFGGFDISPDGKRLAVSQSTTCIPNSYYGCDFGLFIYDLESGNKMPTTLTTGLTPQGPRWSYDGSFITYSYINEPCGPIMAITPDGKNTTTLISADVKADYHYSCNELAVVNKDDSIIAYDRDLGPPSGGMFFTYTDHCTTGSCQFAIPEFQFAIPVLLIGVASLIVFYRIKFRK